MAQKNVYLFGNGPTTGKDESKNKKNLHHNIVIQLYVDIISWVDFVYRIKSHFKQSQKNLITARVLDDFYDLISASVRDVSAVNYNIQWIYDAALIRFMPTNDALVEDTAIPAIRAAETIEKKFFNLKKIDWPHFIEKINSQKNGISLVYPLGIGIGVCYGPMGDQETLIRTYGIADRAGKEGNPSILISGKFKRKFKKIIKEQKLKMGGGIKVTIKGMPDKVLAYGLQSQNVSSASM